MASIYKAPPPPPEKKENEEISDVSWKDA